MALAIVRAETQFDLIAKMAIIFTLLMLRFVELILRGFIKIIDIAKETFDLSNSQMMVKLSVLTSWCKTTIIKRSGAKNAKNTTNNA